jgi:hypothetical protein
MWKRAFRYHKGFCISNNLSDLNVSTLFRELQQLHRKKLFMYLFIYSVILQLLYSAWPPHTGGFIIYLDIR